MWWIPPMYGAEGSTNLRSGDPDGSPGEGEALDPRHAAAAAVRTMIRRRR
jgi:hypothetical protein